MLEVRKGISHSGGGGGGSRQASIVEEEQSFSGCGF